MLPKWKKITQEFDIEGDIIDIKQLGDGFINDTYVVTTNIKNYILQRKNHNIFKDVPSMMLNIFNVTNYLRQKVEKAGGDTEREVMRIIGKKNGDLYHKTEEGEYWTLTLMIDNINSYNSASSEDIAYEGGRAIGNFQLQLSLYKEKLHDILPGFHNMRFRYEQWDTAIKENSVGRVTELTKEIEWVTSRRDEMLKFWTLVENGTIPMRVTHNDTKINNILFDNDGKALCVIDLDTVLSSTVLNDFGDAIRTYANTGEEDDTNLERVTMDINMFRAFTKGYLSAAKHFLTPIEKEYLAFSARYIVFEQVLRFLMDYINGDTYYKIKYPSHNLVRTYAQYALLQSIEEQYDEMIEVVMNETKK